MEESFILISTLNDFIFCPYSIYLHNVYESTDESLFHATPQAQGCITHETVDEKRGSTSRDVIYALPVYSERYGLMGKIDVYRIKEKCLIERKYQLRQIYQGQLYQLWAQILCLQEMGYTVERLAFYEISTKRTIPVAMPSEDDIQRFEQHLCTYRNYDPSLPFQSNPNKCRHCVYCSLCDKTSEDNVYQ
jgi:CRISPR-associated protein Cas4